MYGLLLFQNDFVTWGQELRLILKHPFIALTTPKFMLLFSPKLHLKKKNFPLSSQPHWFLDICEIVCSQFSFWRAWFLYDTYMNFFIHMLKGSTELGKVLEVLNSLYTFFLLASFFKNFPLTFVHFSLISHPSTLITSSGSFPSFLLNMYMYVSQDLVPHPGHALP